MSIWVEIVAERARAHAKHGSKSMESAAWDDMKRLRILVEEVGEIARAFNELDLGNATIQETRERAKGECVQVAAMAGAWADVLGMSCNHEDLNCPVGSCDWSERDGRDG